MNKYYLVKENIDLAILINYGYYKNPNGDYTKRVTIADKSERQLIEISHHTRRIFL